MLEHLRPFSPINRFRISQESRPGTPDKSEYVVTCEVASSAKHAIPSHLLGVPSRTRINGGIQSPQGESYRRASRRRSTLVPRELPARIFKILPREVYDCIVDQLDQLHLGKDQSCPACYLRDLSSLSVTSRAWDRVASFHLYKKIWVPSHEHSNITHIKILGTTRLKLLRRTLRERKVLAKLVRELHMPDFQALHYNATIDKEEILNLVASVVMACPNLERLHGFHVPYTHSFDRLSYALSTRPMLKERLWCIAENEMGRDEEEEEDLTHGYYHTENDPTECFLELNSRHSALTTLALHQETSRASTELSFRAIIGTLRQYSALRHLSVSGFSSTSFSNIALHALPAGLQSLRLENLPGINDKGLLRFSTSSSATTLQSLVLVNLEISNLLIISNLFHRLSSLKRFSLAQRKTPISPRSIAHPVLQSSTLEYIHWELRSGAGPSPSLLGPILSKHKKCFPFANVGSTPCSATSLLASNIREGLIPQLRRIRAPCDPQGLLQALCKPMGTALLPSDLTLFTSISQTSLTKPIHQHSYSATKEVELDTMSMHSTKEYTTSPYIRIDSAGPSPTTPQGTSFDFSSAKLEAIIRRTNHLKGIEDFQNVTPVTPVTPLRPSRSRLTAEARILSARDISSTSITIHDPNGQLATCSTIRGYIGDINSRIVYDLQADRNRDAEQEEDRDGGMEHQWITSLGDVMGEREVAGKKNWGKCGHKVDGRVGGNSVGVSDLF